jgi:transcriptional regulator with XRE-family HTH domain
VPEQPTPTPVAPAPPRQEEARPDPLAASVAAAVSKLRRDAGLSERAAAKKLGTSQTQLRRMEDPRYLPSLRSLARVAQAYGAQIRVSFEAQDEKSADKNKPRPAPAKAAAAPKPARMARASGSPSRGRRAAPGRARGGARGKPRRAAPRRKAR